jgi:hypothetical protein
VRSSRRRSGRCQLHRADCPRGWLRGARLAAPTALRRRTSGAMMTREDSSACRLDAEASEGGAAQRLDEQSRAQRWRQLGVGKKQTWVQLRPVDDEDRGTAHMDARRVGGGRWLSHCSTTVRRWACTGPDTRPWSVVGCWHVGPTYLNSSLNQHKL